MSREQWMHGYMRGFNDGIAARVSFKNFIISLYHDRDDPFGDFARDVMRDKKFPTHKSRFDDTYYSALEGHIPCCPPERYYDENHKNEWFCGDIVWYLFDTLFHDWENFKDGKPVIVRQASEIPLCYLSYSDLNHLFVLESEQEYIKLVMFLQENEEKKDYTEKDVGRVATSLGLKLRMY